MDYTNPGLVMKP